MTGAKNKLFLGTFIHSKSRKQLEYLVNTAICVDARGVIVAIEEDCDQAAAEARLYPRLGWKVEEVSVKTCKGESDFFFPGFIGEILSVPFTFPPLLSFFFFFFSVLFFLIQSPVPARVRGVSGLRPSGSAFAVRSI